MSDPSPLDPTIAFEAAQRVARATRFKSGQDFGDFELIEEIARGGMGVVYKARQRSLNRTVAVKMILAGQLASADDVQRFRTEAEAAANLQHPNIVAIHEVGDHAGQHYFSMEYVHGPNLAEVVRENPLPAQPAAQIAKTIADAVHYAHQRGIIHRDLKPSNVLMMVAGETRDHASDENSWRSRTTTFDVQNAVPKVTDFGLAKRIDGGSELTGTNQVLGTPSYMPPECASGAKSNLAPTGDVYSLGAILYELLTARPPFRAETPLDTLMQAIGSEPVRPRLLNTNVPRDLETICLKCLRKVPGDRYATAAALSDDLRRFLSGDSILARRPGLLELTGRWVQKQRRSVATALIAALAASLILIVGLISRVAYNQWRLGYVSMNTDGTLLTAEILDATDQLVLPRFSVPTQELVSLPTGSYNLRLTGPSLLSETYQLFVDRAKRHEFRIPSETRQLWEPLQVPRSYEVVDVGGRSHLILLTAKGLQRLDGKTAKLVWESDLDSAARPHCQNFSWDWSTTMKQSGRGSFDRRPLLVRPLVDIDGDKILDLVWAGRHQAFLVAVSGASGDVLWCHLDKYVDETLNQPGDKAHRESAILGQPASRDIDLDGVPDFVVTCAAVNRDPTVGAGSPSARQRWVEAVSGRSGKALWRTDLESHFGQRPAFTPIVSRWPISRNTWSMSGYTGTSEAGFYDTHVAHLNGPWDFIQAPFAAEIAQVSDKGAAVLIAGSKLVCLDVETGAAISPVNDLGFESLRAPLVTDLDGDKRAEVLVFRPLKRPMGMGRDAVVEMTALSLPTATKLWSVVLEAAWDGFNWYDDPPQWPLVADLDDDGNQEVVVSNQPSSTTSLPSTWSGIQVVDGRSGHVRWHARIRSIHRQLDRFVVGPDIDSDGQRDLFVASMVAWPDNVQRFSLFVDAVSGQDGHTIWWREVSLGDSYEVCEGLGIDPLFWWNTGLDGWPQLVVPYLPDPTRGVPKTFIFSAGTGQIAYTAAGICDSTRADLDGNGVAELLSFRPYEAGRFDAGGKLVAVSTAGANGWQRLGGIWKAAQDLDQDGLGDLIKPDDDLTAISGRDGSILWHAQAAANSFTSPSLRHGDFNRDGLPDILVPYRLGITTVMGMGMVPLQAISGRTGERLWATDPVTVFAGMQFLEVADLEGDGQAEIVFVSAIHPRSRSSSDWNWQLTVYDAFTGKIRWQQPLTDVDRSNVIGHFDADFRIQTEFADLNDDAILDLIFPVFLTSRGYRYEVRAFSGLDGKPLWSHPLPTLKSASNVKMQVPTIWARNLTGDSTPEVLIGDFGPERYEIVALDANNGGELWSWRAPGPVTSIAASELAVADQPPDRPPLIGAYFQRNGGDQSSNAEFVLLDHLGKVVQRRAIAALVGGYRPAKKLQCWDIDHDGRREWLFFDQGKLLALTTDLSRVVWEWSLPYEAENDVVLTLEQQSPWILLHISASGSSSRLFMLDERTGEVRWQHEAKEAQLSFIRSTNPDRHSLLISSNEQATFSIPTPQLIASNAKPRKIATASIARTTLPDVRVPGSTSAKKSSNARTVQTRTHADDPRFIRPLPWVHMRDAAFGVAIAIVVSVVGLVVPGSIVISAVRHRRWSLRRFLAVPVLVAAVIAFFRFLASETVDISAHISGFSGPFMFGWRPTSQVLNSPLWLLMLGLQGFPIVFFLGVLINSLQAWQWRRVIRVLGLFALLVAVLTGVMLIYDSGQMDPRERYAWRDFIWCLYPPAFMAGSVLLLGSFGKHMWSAALRLRKARKL